VYKEVGYCFARGFFSSIDGIKYNVYEIWLGFKKYKQFLIVNTSFLFNVFSIQQSTNKKIGIERIFSLN